MPFKTRYGSHYHMTQGCHGADIPCGTEGLSPCSDCCGSDRQGGGTGVPATATGGGTVPTDGERDYDAELEAMMAAASSPDYDFDEMAEDAFPFGDGGTYSLHGGSDDFGGDYPTDDEGDDATGSAIADAGKDGAANGQGMPTSPPTTDVADALRPGDESEFTVSHKRGGQVGTGRISSMQDLQDLAGSAEWLTVDFGARSVVGWFDGRQTSYKPDYATPTLYQLRHDGSDMHIAAVRVESLDDLRRLVDGHEFTIDFDSQTIRVRSEGDSFKPDPAFVRSPFDQMPQVTTIGALRMRGRFEGLRGQTYTVIAKDYEGTRRINTELELQPITTRRGERLMKIQWTDHYFDKGDYCFVPLDGDDQTLDSITSYSDYEADRGRASIKAMGIDDHDLRRIVADAKRAYRIGE